MSLDLTLLPFNCDHEGHSYSHTVLPLQTNSYSLFDEIKRLMNENLNSLDFITDGEPIKGELDKDFTCYVSRDENYGDSHYGRLDTDAYGEKVLWVRASVLQRLSNHKSVLDNPLNKQAWGYLIACPANTKIALYWH